ncbi:hypothetical protein PV-S19_0099 [Pacmanvirus S19]|nr:hypothetical protein PV-S19_0099 [Pacmanvirus S19]
MSFICNKCNKGVFSVWELSGSVCYDCLKIRFAKLKTDESGSSGYGLIFMGYDDDVGFTNHIVHEFSKDDDRYKINHVLRNRVNYIMEISAKNPENIIINDKFINIRLVYDTPKFELLLLKNDPDHKFIEYQAEGSEAYDTITKWAQIGNLKQLADSIKITHNGILYSEKRHAFVEFNHSELMFDFRKVKCLGYTLGDYLNDRMDFAKTFVVEEDNYSSVVDDAEELGCISSQIRIKRKYLKY